MGIRIDIPVQISRGFRIRRGQRGPSTVPPVASRHRPEEPLVRFLWRSGIRLALARRMFAARRARLDSFEETFDALVDHLCAAARHGVGLQSNVEYTVLRENTSRQYRRLQNVLRAYWSCTGTKDPFAELVKVANIRDAITAAESIENLMRSRRALSGYRKSLSQSKNCGSSGQNL